MEADGRNDLPTRGYKSLIFPTKLIGHIIVVCPTVNRLSDLSDASRHWSP